MLIWQQSVSSFLLSFLSGVFIMRHLTSLVRTFLISEDGPTAVEYAVMLALIVVVCLAAISSIGTNASNVFSSAASSLGAGS